MSSLTIRATQLLRDAFTYAKPVYFPMLAFFVPTLLITLISSTITSPSANLLLQFIELIFVTPFITGTSIFYVHQNLTQRGATVPQSLQAGGEKFFQLSLLTIILIVLLIPAFILLIVPGIYLSIRWSFVFYAVMIEGCSASDALGRSWTLTKENWWLIFRAGLLFTFALIIPIFILAILFAATIGSAIPDLPEFIGGIVGFLIAPLGSIYYVLLFMSLVNMAMDDDKK